MPLAPPGIEGTAATIAEVYSPPFNRVSDEDEIRAMVRDWGSAELITVDGGRPVATLLPIIWSGDTVIAHLARANQHWRSIGEGTPALLICGGPQAYVSPSYYPSKGEHGRVVPTWNYSSVHLSGAAYVHHDADWLRSAVTLLTGEHEGQRPDPWSVYDAPEAFIDGQLRGIVGVEIRVEKIEAKAKLSQNRSTADRQGVVLGLESTNGPLDGSVADLMRSALPSEL